MSSWGSRLNSSTKVVDNHKKSIGAKIELRMLAMEAVGADSASVLDCFAGSGHMYDSVWCCAASYVGCDKKWFPGESHKAFVCDNNRLLRCLDLSAYNVFDLDAYGSPWGAATIIAARRRVERGELLAVVLTDGSAMGGCLGKLEYALANLSGAAPAAPGCRTMWKEISLAAIKSMAARMGGSVVDLWQADALKRHMLYSAFTIRGQ